MVTLHQANIDVRVTESACAFVAICMTITRLYIRRTRLWWDDAWAIFSFVFVLLQVVAAFLHVDNYSDLPKSAHIAAYYLLASTFYCIIWSARLSILFSIIRIDPDPRWQHRMKWIAGVFVAALLFFLAQLFWVCEPEGHVWKNLPSPQCRLGLQVVVCQVVSDVIADLLLIALPIRLIYSMSNRTLRRRLMFIFSTAIVTTLVSLVHAAYIIKEGTTTVLISAIVEDCMSLTVANLPVVATAMLRTMGIGSADHKPETSDDTADPEGKHWKSTAMRFRSILPTRDSVARTTGRWGTSQQRQGASTRGEAPRVITTSRWGQSTGAGTFETGTSAEDSVGWASTHNDPNKPIPLDIEAAAGSRSSTPGMDARELKSIGDVPLALVSHHSHR